MPVPAAADVIAFLTQTSGVTIPAGSAAAIDSLIASAAEEVSHLTGYTPFVGADSTKRIKQSRVIRLPNGLYGTISLTVLGTALVLDKDFRYGPTHVAGVSGEPYEWIELIRAPGSAIMEIDGTWGYADDYPEPLLTAMIELVAGRYLESVRQGQVAGGNWKEADSSRDVVGGSKIGGDEGELAGGAMINRAKAAIMKYRRFVGYA